jgi:hypothetical protein
MFLLYYPQFYLMPITRKTATHTLIISQISVKKQENHAEKHILTRIS